MYATLRSIAKTLKQREDYNHQLRRRVIITGARKQTKGPRGMPTRATILCDSFRLHVRKAIVRESLEFELETAVVLNAKVPLPSKGNT